MREHFKTWLLRNRGSSPLLARLMDVLLYGDALKEIIYSYIFFSFAGYRPRRNSLVTDFLVIGAQKAATTWLEEALRGHPGIRMPAGRKELHYFTNGYWKGERWYLWHFRGGESLLKGEVTPRYSIIDEEWIHRVKEFNPELKILFILRNPVERAWSMATMDLLRNPSRAVDDVSDERFLSHFQSPGSIARGTYTITIEKWRKVFGE